MKKKLVIISAAAVLALGGLATIAGAIGSGNMSITKAATAHTEHADSDGTERAFYAPGTYTHLNENGEEVTDETGTIPYWRCNSCCSSNPDSARYDLKDHNKALTLADVQIPALTKAAKSDIAAGDEIANVNLGKFKYVDQGANGVDGKEGTSTPWYVKDTDGDGKERTAVYFSRSGKTGDAYNVVLGASDVNKDCSEFRFNVPEEYKKGCSSVRFSYKYEDWGAGVWNAADNVAQPKGAHAMIQFKDNGSYVGNDVTSTLENDPKLINDGEWHTMTLNYIGGTTTSFSDLIFKFVDLRGCIMVSGLSYELAPVTVTLKNVNVDGTDKTETVSIGSLPTTPTMDGKKFLGWYDKSGNKVESVTASTTTLIARYSTEYEYSGSKVLKKFTSDPNDYTLPATATFKYTARGSDRDGDIQNGYYPEGIDGTQGFYYPTDASVVAGLGLPAYDFSTSSTVRFHFGFSDSASSVTLNGTSVGDNAKKNFTNFTATIRGKNVVVENQDANTSTNITLSDDVYYGRKGIEITATNAPWRWLVVTPYISLDVDYISEALAIEASLPDTPAAGNYKDSVENYQKLREVYSTEEKTLYPQSDKMTAWIAYYSSVTTLASFANNEGIVITNPDASHTASADSTNYSNGKTAANGSVSNDSAFIWCGGLTDYCAAVTLPAINYSSYAKAEFTLGFANNVGQDGPGRYLYLGDASATFDSTSPTTASNYIGQATKPDASNYWATATDIAVTIANGNITFKNASVDKTLALDTNVNNGTKGLTISFANLCWEYLVISPITGTAQ